MMNRSAVVLALLLASAARMAAAQEEPPVAPPIPPPGVLPVGTGARLRLTPVGSPAVTGYLAGAGARGLTLALPTDNPLTPLQHVEFPVESLMRVEVSIGKKHHLWIGALFGAMAFAVMGFAEEVDPYDCSGMSDAFCSQGEAVAVMAVTGALIGGTVGFFVKKEKWLPVAVDALAAPPRASERAEPAPLTAGVTFRF